MKKKRFLFIGVFIVLTILVMYGCSNEKENKKQLTEGEYFEQVILPEFDEILEEYTKFWSEEWQGTLFDLNEGKIDLTIANEKMDVVQTKCENLIDTIQSFQLNNGNLSKENKDHFEKHKSHIINSLTYRQQAAEKMAVLLKQNDGSSAKMQEIADLIKSSDTELKDAIEERKTLESNLGLESYLQFKPGYEEEKK